MTNVFTLTIDRRRNDSVVDQIRQDIKERMLDKTLIQAALCHVIPSWVKWQEL